MMTTLKMTPAAARKAAAAETAETRRARRFLAQSEAAVQAGEDIHAAGAAGLKHRVSRLQRLIRSEPAYTTTRRRLTKWLRQAQADLKAVTGR